MLVADTERASVADDACYKILVKAGCGVNRLEGRLGGEWDGFGDIEAIESSQCCSLEGQLRWDSTLRTCW
jgi:hypothetical protein